MHVGFSRAKPPMIRKVDLGNEEEVVGLLDDVKYGLNSSKKVGTMLIYHGVRPRVVVHCTILQSLRDGLGICNRWSDSQLLSRCCRTLSR